MEDVIQLAHCQTPLGLVTLAARDEALVGLWLDGQKYDRRTLAGVRTEEKETALHRQVMAWLDRYFAGENPAIDFQIDPAGTPFQKRVWNVMMEVPYGTTATYKDLCQRMVPATSPRAVGNAVGKNPLMILCPCHRIIGADGRLTGYAGGIERKKQLLALERAHTEKQ